MTKHIGTPLLTAALVISLVGNLLGSQKEDQEKRAASPTFEQALSWFPSNTETLTIAEAFDVPQMLKPPQEIATGFADPFRAGLFEGFGNVIAVEALIGHRVSLALQGERNFDVVSAFGSWRREACSIFFFEQDLGTVWNIIVKPLRAKATKVRSMVGHEVFQFPSTTVMESSFKLKKWQGLFVVRVEPNVLMIASSDRYLEDLLRRRDSKPKERALPKTLPEWQHVDQSTPFYMVRDIPIELPRTFFTGVTWSWKPEKLVVTFVGARPGAEKAIRYLWTGGKDLTLPVQPSIRAEEGRIVVTLMTDKFREDFIPSFFWYRLLVYRVHGDDGTLFSGRAYIPEALRPVPSLH